MNLKDKLEVAIKEAMIGKDELTLSVSRLIKSAIKNAEIEAGSELDEAGILVVIEKQAKQRRDSIDQFQKAGRQDLVDKEALELKIIEAYLPAKMSEDEVRAVVTDIVAQNQGQDFGRLMGVVMGQLKGKADGAMVQKIVREVTES